jgi:hypothetical protein
MRKLFLYVFASVVTLVSCNSDKELKPSKEGVKMGYEYVVGFDLQKDGISIKGDEMSGGGTEEPAPADLYAIKITEEGGDIVASGLYDSNFDMSTLEVKLKHGFTYTVEATMLKYGTAMVGGSTTEGAGAPFNDQTICASAEEWTKSPKTFTDLAGQGILEDDNTCFGERWYYKGSFEADFNGTADEKTIKINLRRVSFALKFVQENLQEGYTCEVALSASVDNTVEPLDSDFCTYSEVTTESQYSLPNIGTAYTNIIAGSDAPSTETYKFKYRIKDASQNVIKTSEVFTIGQCKANYRYTINLDCSTNADCSISISMGDTWQDL